MERMIVKIQKPLESNKANPPALVYTEDRGYETLVPMSRVLAMVLRGRPKIYCEVEVLPDGDLGIIREVEGLSW